MSAVLKGEEPNAPCLEALHLLAVKHFDLVASAPDGVARLRELILTLAVQGKLVHQDPNDEPATELLARIAMEKAKRSSVGRGGRDTVLEAPRSERESARIPSGWSWARLKDLVLTSEAGWSPTCHPAPRRPGNWGVLKVSAVSWGEFAPDANKELPAGLAPRPEYEVKSGDFLLSRANTDQLVARSVVVGDVQPRLMLSDKIIRLDISTEMNRRFVCMWNNASYARAYYASHATGTSSSMKNVSREVVLGLRVAVPPMPEQARIVARVDELMRVCDALEDTGRIEAEKHQQLMNILLETLTSSGSLEELSGNWARVARHFDLLLDRPETVDAFEETILRLAVRGLLVQRNGGAMAGDPEATCRRSHPTEPPFPIPESWSWATLEELCVIRGGATPSKAAAHLWTGDIPWVSPKDMKIAVISDSQDHVSSAALGSPLSLIPAGSLLIVVRGMILAHSFPVAQTSAKVTINQDMKALTPRNPDLLPFLLLACQGMKAEILALVERSTHGTCKLESSKIFGLPFPVPPLPEQRLIVARVEQLRRHCSELRNKLAAARDVHGRVADALTHQAAARIA